MAVKFTGLPYFTFNFNANFELDSEYKATTLPNLGLVENLDEIEGFDSIEHLKADAKPWDRVRAWIEHKNKQTDDTQYKVLYLTRHGLGFHNAYESQVGHDAWNVSAPSYSFPH